MVNILIVEKDLDFARKIIAELSIKNNSIRFCGIMTNYYEFIEFTQKYSVDIFIMDFDILKLIPSKYLMNYDKSIILISNKEITRSDSFDSRFVFESISKKYVLSHISKSIASLLKSKFKMTGAKNKRDLIIEELNYLGYNLSYKGTLYLLETIYLINNSGINFDNNLSKEIYPLVAKKFNTTPLNVKYNIRNATISMYNSCEREKLYDYLNLFILEVPKPKTIIQAIESNVRKKSK